LRVNSTPILRQLVVIKLTYLTFYFIYFFWHAVCFILVGEWYKQPSEVRWENSQLPQNIMYSHVVDNVQNNDYKLGSVPLSCNASTIMEVQSHLLKKFVK
jgi:hypothetical protein